MNWKRLHRNKCLKLVGCRVILESIVDINYCLSIFIYEFYINDLHFQKGMVKDNNKGRLVFDSTNY